MCESVCKKYDEYVCTCVHSCVCVCVIVCVCVCVHVCVHVCVFRTWYGKVKMTFLRVQRVSSLLLTFCQKHQVVLWRDEQTFLEEQRAR